METEGLVLDLQTITKLREDFRELSSDLRYRLDQTDESIETVAKAWQDENFQKFYQMFKQDKDRLEPLFQRVDVFENEFLTDVEMNLREYLALQDSI
jgi:predicted nuclease with TOPRIM domain